MDVPPLKEELEDAARREWNAALERDGMDGETLVVRFRSDNPHRKRLDAIMRIASEFGYRLDVDPRK